MLVNSVNHSSDIVFEPGRAIHSRVRHRYLQPTVFPKIVLVEIRLEVENIVGNVLFVEDFLDIVVI
jgi:hypothetical protein